MTIAIAATRRGVFTNTLEVKNNGSFRNLNPRSSDWRPLYSASSSALVSSSGSEGMLVAPGCIVPSAPTPLQYGGLIPLQFGLYAIAVGGLAGDPDEDLAQISFKEFVQDPPQPVVV